MNVNKHKRQIVMKRCFGMIYVKSQRILTIIINSNFQYFIKFGLLKKRVFTYDIRIIKETFW
jgi:hypothetical protein